MGRESREGFEIVEMSPADATQELVEELARVASDAFGSQITPEEMKAHLGDRFYVAYYGDEVAGFSSYEDLSIDSLCAGCHALRYLAGAFVYPEYQGRGLYNDLLRRRIGNHGIVYVTRTQNPLVAKAFALLMREMGYETYPLRFDGRFSICDVPECLKELGEFLAGKYGGGKLVGKMYRGQLVRNYPSNDYGFSDLFDVQGGEGVVLFAVPSGYGVKDLSSAGNYSCGDEDTVPVG